jgi:hypothetical protein
MQLCAKSKLRMVYISAGDGYVAVAVMGHTACIGVVEVLG